MSSFLINSALFSTQSDQDGQPHKSSSSNEQDVEQDQSLNHTGLGSLPVEIMLKIAGNLSVCDAISFANTCNHTKQIMPTKTLDHEISLGDNIKTFLKILQERSEQEAQNAAAPPMNITAAQDRIKNMPLPVFYFLFTHTPQLVKDLKLEEFSIFSRVFSASYPILKDYYDPKLETVKLLIKNGTFVDDICSEIPAQWADQRAFIMNFLLSLSPHEIKTATENPGFIKLLKVLTNHVPPIEGEYFSEKAFPLLRKAVSRFTEEIKEEHAQYFLDIESMAQTHSWEEEKTSAVIESFRQYVKPQENLMTHSNLILPIFAPFSAKVLTKMNANKDDFFPQGDPSIADIKSRLEVLEDLSNLSSDQENNITTLLQNPNGLFLSNLIGPREFINIFGKENRIHAFNVVDLIAPHRNLEFIMPGSRLGKNLILDALRRHSSSKIQFILDNAPFIFPTGLGLEHPDIISAFSPITIDKMDVVFNNRNTLLLSPQEVMAHTVKGSIPLNPFDGFRSYLEHLNALSSDEINEVAHNTDIIFQEEHNIGPIYRQISKALKIYTQIKPEIRRVIMGHKDRLFSDEITNEWDKQFNLFQQYLALLSCCSVEEVSHFANNSDFSKTTSYEERIKAFRKMFPRIRISK